MRTAKPTFQRCQLLLLQAVLGERCRIILAWLRSACLSLPGMEGPPCTRDELGMSRPRWGTFVALNLQISLACGQANRNNLPIKVDHNVLGNTSGPVHAKVGSSCSNKRLDSHEQCSSLSALTMRAESACPSMCAHAHCPCQHWCDALASK